MVVVGISTLQGTIIQVECEPSTVVRDFKQQCIEASPVRFGTSSVNEDLVHLMKDYDPDKPLVLRRYDGIRLVHWNGDFMDDCMTIASQVSSWGENEFMFKLVFMNQYNFTDQEKDMLSKFAQGYSDSVVTMPNGTQFIAMPVWGGADRPNHILGIFYQHARTDDHCQLAMRGVDPREVHSDGPVFGFDVDGDEVQPINFAGRE